MGTPSTVLTMGLGSFGSVGLLLTLGYSFIASDVPIGLEYTARDNRLQYTAPDE